ncbi:MAG: IS630 family transposase [Pseudobdellovibrionaceae bacterium]|nr:IS630 family transposase [Pseudobdellovibrionaceae bacterium]
MRPKITASSARIAQLHSKMNRAKEDADISCMRRCQGLIGVLMGKTYRDVSCLIGVSEETLRLWINAYLVDGIRSVISRRSPGRPSKLTKSQKSLIKKVIKSGPEAAGYTSGCWNCAMIQDYIYRTFAVLYSVNYIAQLLKNMGMSYQKAAFSSAHHDPKKREEWLKTTWPKLLKLSRKKDSYLLFGDEASFPQWGSLSYTWAPKGEQPLVKTPGVRRGYKVFGLIDYWTGKFFHKAITEKFTSESYADFLKGVLAKTRKHLIVIQDGAAYHTSEHMCVFFYENRERLTIAQMPSYSPDYNPIEILWKKVKLKGIHLKYFSSFNLLMETVDRLLSEISAAPKDVLKVFGFYKNKQTA